MSLGPLHIIKQTNAINSASVIFLHGSGDTGQGILNWIQFLIKNFSFPHVDFYFPTAPKRPYTPMGGALSTVWFDRYDISPDVPEHTETIEQAGNEIQKLIQQIETRGIPLNRIIVGGFSMGGALALHTAYRFVPGLAGVFTLSSFLNNNSALCSQIKAVNTPCYMCHGDRDTMVPIQWGQKTYNELKKLGVNAEFIPIRHTMHELKRIELEGLMDWILQILPPLQSDLK